MSKNNAINDESAQDEREIVITRVFDAARELVFDVWTNPIHLARWWGPGGFANPVCEVDLRVNGVWRVVMRAPDGSEVFFTAVYQEIIRPEKLAFSSIATNAESHPILEGLTTVLFEDFEDGQTKLTLRAHAKALVPEAIVRLAGMNEGWSSSLDRLAVEITTILSEGARE
jgi:uncharacterized protein YndB with AHSA1/START domain